MTWPAAFPISFARRVPGPFGNQPVVKLPQKAPNEVAGLTMWLDGADASNLFTDAGTTPVANDGDLIYRLGDKSGNGNHYDQANAGLRPEYKINRQNGLSAAYFDGTKGIIGTSTLADLFNINAKAFFMVSKIFAGWAANDFLLGESSGYWSVQITAGGLIQHRNYDGTTDATIGWAFTQGEAFLYTATHDGVNLYDSLNGAAFPVGVASGNTAGAFTQTPGLMARATNYLPGDMCEMATYDQVPSAANTTLLNNYFRQRWSTP